MKETTMILTGMGDLDVKIDRLNGDLVLTFSDADGRTLHPNDSEDKEFPLGPYGDCL